MRPIVIAARLDPLPCIWVLSLHPVLYMSVLWQQPKHMRDLVYVTVTKVPE